jgi:methylated-DNA-protein-cysteine methyltransferase related protein
MPARKPRPRTSGMLQRIRAAIAKIPRGKVSTYGQVARAAGFPGAARQVVWALQGAYALPWHRVLGAGGRIRLPGPAGQEQRLKLELEGVAFSGLKVRMKEHEFKWTRRRAKSRHSR